jgi:hypothetical protein
MMWFYDSSISSGTFGEGDAGAVTVMADDLVLDNLGFIASNTSGEGDAGAVTVMADDLVLDNLGFISSDTNGKGDAGAVTVSADDLILRDGGLIDSDSFAQGDAGTVTVMAEQLLISGVPGLFTGISSETLDRDSAANAGTVTVAAVVLDIRDGGLISSDTFAQGDAGRVTVTADQLLISGVAGLFTGISSEALDRDSAANAGTVTVAAVVLDIRNGTISSAAFGDGDAGAVMVASDRLLLEHGEITTTSAAAGGGEIRLLVEDVIHLRSSAVTTSVAGGDDPTAGNILIDPKVLVIDGSTIEADAGTGSGGNVRIIADNILVPEGDLDGLIARGDISAFGETEVDSGTVAISAPETDIAGGLVVLDAALLDAASQLRERCGARRDIGASSFTGVGRGGLPPSPDGPLLSDYAPQEKPTAGSAVEIDERDEPKAAPGAVTLVVPCRGPA